MDANKPEPKPVPTEERPTWELVIEDMRERDRAGRAKYGTPLQPNNGRNSLVDLYQELLDATVYVKNEIIKQQLLIARIERIEKLADTVLGPER